MAPPGAPTDLVCNRATNGMPTTITNLIFSWQPPTNSSGINGYSYAFDQFPNNITNTVGTTATITNVTLGTHVFHVMAQDTNGIWGPTADLQFGVYAVGLEPPGAPPGLICNAATNGVPVYTANLNATTISNILFSWQTPYSETGVAGYSYALNATPAKAVNNNNLLWVSYSSIPIGTNIFQVMAVGKNGVWGAASSFQLVVQPLPLPRDTSGPLPPWSITVLTLGVFTAGAWFIRRQHSRRYGH
jgi:hypothetical protein